MTTESYVQRVVLAVERPDLEPTARQYCSQLVPGREIAVLPLDRFAISLDNSSDQAELKVLMLHADKNGLLEQGSPIVQSLISARAPVLVIRQPHGGEVPEPHIERIVVPLDGSTIAGQAIPVASQVARLMNVPVRFVMVIDPSRVIPPAYAYDPDAWGMIEELRQTSHWALSQAEAAMRRDGVTVNSDLLFGPINASLLASIREGDLVVMTTHGPDRQGLRNRDSVALRTLVSVSQPMLIMQAERELPLVVDGYQACSWAEPLQRETARTA